MTTSTELQIVASAWLSKTVRLYGSLWLPRALPEIELSAPMLTKSKDGGVMAGEGKLEVDHPAEALGNQ